jgi:hypothetical protein
MLKSSFDRLFARHSGGSRRSQEAAKSREILFMFRQQDSQQSVRR